MACLLTIGAMLFVLGFLAQGAWAAPLNDDFVDGFETTLSNGSGGDTSDNIGASLENQEPIGFCEGNVWGSTVWYFFLAPGNGTVVVRVNSTDFDPIVNVYRDSDLANVGCNDDDPGGNGLSSKTPSISVTGGQFYDVQIGGYWPGYPGGSPDEGNFVYSVDWTAAVTPPPPNTVPINASIPNQFRFFTKGKHKNRTRIKDLSVVAEPGSTVEVRCQGRCPFADRSLGGTNVNVMSLFGGAFLKPGTVIEILITKPGTLGKYAKFQIRKGKSPRTGTCQIQPTGQLTGCS